MTATLKKTNEKTLPTLYKKASTGKIVLWTISAVDNVIVTVHGQVDGKLQVNEDVVTAGKNIGKKNETTPAEQAWAEAQAKWTKQKKKGYVESVEDARDGAVDEIIEGGISPMLAQRYDERAKHITFPAFAQPKLDGHRCVAVVEKGKVSLWTRTRKRINSMPHIERAIADLFASDPKVYLVLDGELYNHEYRDRFEELTRLIRASEPQPGHEVVQYHVYDHADETGTFLARSTFLDWVFRQISSDSPLKHVETVGVADEDDLMLFFEKCLEKGYEGAMVRNVAGLYEHKRSNDLQKIKEFQDAEFEVVGVEEGRGKLAGHAIFVCQTQDGTRFNAKMKGATAKLAEIFRNRSAYIGKALTVKFQGYTNANNVPRFPVALRLREDV